MVSFRLVCSSTIGKPFRLPGLRQKITSVIDYYYFYRLRRAIYRLCKYGPVQFVDAHSIESAPICRMALILWIPRLRNTIYRLHKSTKRVEHIYIHNL